MPNPFEKRATEYLRDNEAFLAVVTAQPLDTFFAKPAKEGRLYDRLAMIIGTPGSGKTTLARLFEFSTLRTLLRNRSMTNYKPLIDTLVNCGGIDGDHPAVVGARIPLESEYRDFWEFPYADDLKNALLTKLLQARSVLAWLRNLRDSGLTLEQVEVVPRANSHAALAAIGGTTCSDVLARAQEVEVGIYEVSAALVPPVVEDIRQEISAAYRPFDVIKAFRFSDGSTREVRPLIIFDDAHNLHPRQLVHLRNWLARRELRVSRWILTRLDALAAQDVLLEHAGDEGRTGFKESREITTIAMQGGPERRGSRREFRKMAKDMAGRYLSQMPVFNRRGMHSLGDLLSTAPEMLSVNQCERLAHRVDSLQRRYSVSGERRDGFEREVDEYLTRTGQDGEDVRLGMLAILLERYRRRMPTRTLFQDTLKDEERRRPFKVDAGLAHGARIQLLHKYGRPHFFGIDVLCDASSENAEQFLQLAARLVAQLETQLIRRESDATVKSRTQNRLLRERASEMMREWDFPECDLVRRLAEGMAEECVTRSVETNAPLGAGANAFGIPQEEFDEIPASHSDLARILHFGVAYNVFRLTRRYRVKKREWCLIELSGVLSLSYGLTLKRGGFLERDTSDLVRILWDS